MDALRTYLLGRRLLRLAEDGFARAGVETPPIGLTLVLEDIATHPGSSIGEITARTGFPQSHVSTLVARFRQRGIVETCADPRDARRTLVTAAADHVRNATRRGAVGRGGTAVDLAAALPELDRRERDAVAAALEVLAAALIGDPQAAAGRLAERSRRVRRAAAPTDKED